MIERLADPECRSAAITTFEPHTDTTYVPCISLLDFWRVSGPLELVVYAHRLDFGKKAYGNLVELARLQRRSRRHRLRGRLACRPREVGTRVRARPRADGGALRVTVAIRRAIADDIEWLVELLNGEETEPYLSGARSRDRETGRRQIRLGLLAVQEVDEPVDVVGRRTSDRDRHPASSAISERSGS